jgi:DNA-binding LacI/PurR family transcriptional regulator
VLPLDPDLVDPGVGDDEDGPVLREVRRVLQQVDAGLEHGAAAAADPDPWTREHGAPRLVVPVVMQSGEENAFRATRQLLADGQAPDAVFVVAARFVRGVLRAAKEAGCQVPGQLLIAGGVDSVHAREGEPPVTALDLHPDRQAEMAVEMLLARLDEGEVEVEAPRHIPATLRVRASTGGP